MNTADYLKKILSANVEIQHSNECLTLINRSECSIHNDKACYESLESFISFYKLRLSIWETNGYNESKQWNDLFEILETVKEIKLCCFHFYSGKFLFQLYYNQQTESIIKIMKLEQVGGLNREEYIGKANFIHLLNGQIK